MDREQLMPSGSSPTSCGTMRRYSRTILYLLVIVSLSLASLVIISVSLVDIERGSPSASSAVDHPHLSRTIRETHVIRNKSVDPEQDNSSVPEHDEDKETRAPDVDADANSFQKPESTKADSLKVAGDYQLNHSRSVGGTYYTPPPQSGLQAMGVDFNVSTHKALLDVPLTYLTEQQVGQAPIVFVTWSDEKRFAKVKDLIIRLQHYYGGRGGIVIYNIGMTQAQKSELDTVCDVILREFDFSLYPEHISKIESNAFKPVLFREALLVFDAVVWVEPEMAVPISKSQWERFVSVARENGGWAQVKSNPVRFRADAVTLHPEMSQYLPSDIGSGKQSDRKQFMQSGVILAYKTAELYSSVVHWWYVCALDRRCYHDSATSDCQRSTFGQYLSQVCRRNDQTILDVLTFNHFGRELSRYSVYDQILYVSTPMDKKKQIKLCT